MRCYIIDDEQHAIDTIVRYINKSSDLSLLGSSTSVSHALTVLNGSSDVELIFLDVDMPDISGLEAVALLPPAAWLIFTTAHSNYAYDAFQCNAIDFLLKPISFARFTQSIIKAQKQIDIKQYSSSINFKEEQLSLYINPGVRGRVIQIKRNEIIYIEGLKNYVTFYTESGKYTTYLTIAETLATLHDRQFIRIHKSFVINMLKIDVVEGNKVIMKGNVSMSIGASYKEPFMQLIDSITLRSKRCF